MTNIGWGPEQGDVDEADGVGETVGLETPVGSRDAVLVGVAVAAPVAVGVALRVAVRVLVGVATLVAVAVPPDAPHS